MKPLFLACRAGFTLIELMVVVAILATLVGLGAIGVAKTLKGAEATKRTATAKTLKSAIMAYKAEQGEYPLPEGFSSNDATATFGTVTNGNAPSVGNAEIFMRLCGRDNTGHRDDNKRAYVTDTSALSVCKNGRHISKLDAALAGSGVSKDDMIGFVITMNKTSYAKYSRLSQSRAFAPVRISYDFDLDHYEVSIPGENDFDKVIRLN